METQSKNQLKLSETLALPLEAVTETLAILARKGSGKTYAGSVLAEEMLRAGAHVVVVDPLGVWWGLRTGADGEPAGGLPIVIVGGDRADLPLDPAQGAALADLVVEERLSIILDVSRVPSHLVPPLLAAFLRRLYEANREPLHLIVDEADGVAPQSPRTDEAPMLYAMDDIVRRGRARGLGVTLITQRPAVISKNVLTQVEVLIAMRLTGPQDRAAIDKWISANGTDEERKAVMGSLATLAVGQAWVWSPNLLGGLKQVQVRRRDTFDSSATPKVGAAVRAPRALSEVDLGALAARFEAQVTAANENDPAQLRRRIEELSKELSSRPIGEERIVVVEKIVEKRVEVPVLRDGEMERIESVRDAMAEMAKDAAANARELTARLDLLAPAPLTEALTDDVFDPPVRRLIPDMVGVARMRPITPPPLFAASDATDDIAAPMTVEMAGLKKSAQQFLCVLGAYGGEPVSKVTASLLSGLKIRTATWNTMVAQLRRDGWAEFTSSSIAITPRGAQVLGWKPGEAPERLLALWKPVLAKDSPLAARVLETLVEARREGKADLSQPEIAGRIGARSGSPEFGGALKTLQVNGLVDLTGGRVAVVAALFPHGS